MTYNNNKLFKLFQSVDNPSAQTIDENYLEVTGSKCQIVTTSSAPNLVYKFQFYARDTSTKQMLMHVKLQKSNDDFSSNIIDIDECNFNVSGDENTTGDRYEHTISTFFILKDFDSSYLRIVARSYSSSYESILHRSSYYDGSSATTIYYNPNLIVLEV